MTIVAASGDRQRVVLISDTLTLRRDGQRQPHAFFSKTMTFPHVMAAAALRGHGGHKLAIFHAMNSRPAPGGIGAMPWRDILDHYIGADHEPFDCILAGWSAAAGGFGIWRFGDATDYELAEVALPATVLIPDFGTPVESVMTDQKLIHVAELQVQLANESGREREGPGEPDGAGGDLILTELTAAGIVQRKVKRLPNYEALKEQMA